MEFIKQNYVLTTTGVVVQSNTTTVEFLLDRSEIFQYASSGYNNDLTTTTITFNFDETLSVSRIALLSHNLKAFTIYYNGATASTFSMSTTSDTITSDYSTNSATSKYLVTTAVDCTSVSIDMKSTIVANSEKALGHIVISTSQLEFDRLPQADNYNPVLVANNVEHTLSNGGTRIQTIDENWNIRIAYDHITESFRNNLKTTYDAHEEMIFVPFGTATGWSDKIIFPCVWSGAFNFYKYSDNAVSSGFSGSLTIKETPR